MKKNSVVVFVLGLVIGLYGNIGASIKYTPVADLTLNGGQYSFEGESSSFGGNSSLYFTPGLNFSDKTALIPLLSLEYSGTQDVENLAGGDTLTSQSASGGGLLKFITSFNNGIKTKIRISYKKNLINETKDEDWTEGLFDYDRMLYGIEIENDMLGHSVSLGVDYYKVSFPNYASLVSQTKDEFETSIDTQTYTEISKNSGKNVLDYSDVMIKVDALKKYTKNLTADYSYSFDLRNYKDQTIVQSDGSFSSTKRKDRVQTVNAGLEYQYKRAVVGIANETTFLNSNQNSFDAGVTKYIKDFYSYSETAFTPSVSLYMGKRQKLQRLSIWWDMAFRRYSGRLVQQEDATYTSDKVKEFDNSFGASYRYPIFKEFYATASINRKVVSSNMKYEGNYKYNYSATNYYCGINWQY